MSLRAAYVSIEEEMSRTIDARWDRTPDLTLEENNILT
jgi:hypothetical protein